MSRPIDSVWPIGVTILPGKKRYQLSLKTMLIAVSVAAIGFAGLHFLSLYPQMMPAVAIVGMFCGIAWVMDYTSKSESRSRRVRLGCAFLLLFYTGAVVLQLLVQIIRAYWFNNPTL